jgi:2-polyprenyl-6-methoxyphenol hydroxylase-like FAD-dependent oxidoreductase
MSDQHAEVVGGGLVGLASAALLAQAGWSVTVHERASGFREVGAAIGVRGRAAAVLKKIGVLDRLAPLTVLLTSEERFNGAGELIQARTRDLQTASYNPLRQDLINTLRDVCVASGVETRTGSRVADVRTNGEVVLADGTVRQADIVIAADGFRSRLRYHLGLEQSARILASGTTRVLFPREDDPDIVREYWSGKLRMGVAPTTAGITYAYLSCPEADAHASGVPIDSEYWSYRFPGVPRRFFERIEAGGGVRHLYPLVRCRSWVAGRVALVGDSAHAMPSTLGFAGSMAFINANALVESLGPSVEDSLTAWDAAERPPAERIQRWASVYDAVTVRCPPRLDDLRNRGVRLLSNPWVRAQLFRG